MSGDEEIEKPLYPFSRKKFGTLDGNLGYPHKQQPSLSYSQISSPNFDIVQLKSDMLAREEQKRLDELVFLEEKFMRPILGVMGHFEYPIPSVEQVLRKSDDWGINQLRPEIEMMDFEIDKRKEVKQIMAATFTKEKVEDALWKRRPLEIVTKSEGRTHQFYPNTIEEADELLALEKEAQQIFDARIKYFTAIKAGYEARLREMSKAAPNILKQKLSEIQQVVQDAERTINKIRKTAYKNQETHNVRGRDAVKFMDEREHFGQLQVRYIQLTAEIRNYADPDTKIIPFPDNLTFDDRMSTSEIEQAAETERKGIKDYSIFSA